MAELIGYVQRYAKLDDHTVRIDLVRPYGLLRSHLPNLPITHRDYADKRHKQSGWTAIARRESEIVTATWIGEVA